ncbi:MAG: B12-binding domain-containing radical SAM protein, partial [Dehalococcoidales bacterium]|nr:B12-binding domain-containing radical SAM protein [Dehalococcoidales bacterium]
MKALLVYPQYPDTFWSFKHALKLSRKQALNTPLGPITVAALLPADWEKKFVDLNVDKLKDKDIKWADYVFVSAMVVQQKSTMEVIQRCKKLNTKVVAGGPLFTT